MAALDTATRRAIWQRLMAEGHFPPALLKADLIAAVNAVDDWTEANAASYNTALPQPFRGAATPAEKALILAYVALRRAGVV